MPRRIAAVAFVAVIGGSRPRVRYSEESLCADAIFTLHALCVVHAGLSMGVGAWPAP